MASKPKKSKAEKQLQQISLERERELRVENARATTKVFSDNIAFRRKLRGVFSLLSGGFKGFGGGTALGGGQQLGAG